MITKIFRHAYRAQNRLNFAEVSQSKEFRQLRTDYYEHLWRQAAANLGDAVSSGSFGYLRISRDGLTTIVRQGFVMLDCHLTLDIMGNKALTYALLAEKQYPTPDHQTFTIRSLPDAEAMLARQRGRAVVVKPVSGTGGGIGVTTGIRDAKSLRKAAWMANQFDSDLIVEEQADGESFRLLYLGGEFIDAIRRDRPEVTGNGRHSIRQLVAIENLRRLREQPTVALSPLRVDRDCLHFLQQQQLTPRSVPENGRAVQIKRAVNENRAERNHGVKDQVHPETIETGRRLVSDFGVEFAGLDVLCKDIGARLSPDNGWISEVNTTPGIHHHYLVSEQTPPVRVAEIVLDHIFATQRGTMKLASGVKRVRATPRRAGRKFKPTSHQPIDAEM